jgi:hypothetical protein
MLWSRKNHTNQEIGISEETHAEDPWRETGAPRRQVVDIGRLEHRISGVSQRVIAQIISHDEDNIRACCSTVCARHNGHQCRDKPADSKPLRQRAPVAKPPTDSAGPRPDAAAAASAMGEIDIGDFCQVPRSKPAQAEHGPENGGG